MSAALFSHCETIYTDLQNHSEQEEIDGQNVLLFRGSKSAIFNDSGISKSYYSSVYKLLEDMGCIITLQNGTRNVSSVIILLRPPTMGELPADLTGLAAPARVVAQRISDVETQLGGINVPIVLADLKKLVDKMEVVVDGLDKRVMKLEKESRVAKTKRS